MLSHHSSKVNSEKGSEAASSKRSKKSKLSGTLKKTEDKMKKEFMREQAMLNSIEIRSAFFWHTLTKLIKKKKFKQVNQWLERFYEGRIRDN